MRIRKQNRLHDYDYRTPGAYFITTVVRDRQNTFGEVKDGAIRLSPYGDTLVEQWHWLHKQYQYITLDQFVVMPNHFHGIIIIVGTGRDPSLQPKTKSLS
jgi:putative transposase